MLNGLDALIDAGFAGLQGKRVALLCNQASIAKSGVHALDALMAGQSVGGYEVVAAFGPQHGIWGHTQDNMIEWEGYRDARTGLPFYSLYGEKREPKDAWLAGVDELIVDLVDVGARYYTFIWTLAECLKVCERLGVAVRILDRVNPIGGVQVEGTVLDPAFRSFVGLYPLPMRHGMTIGEIARYLQRGWFPDVELSVEETRGWDRAQYVDETDLMWAPPSPNMPTVDTAVVYPGACLIEATNLSEGRGTTRPFETFGAPYLDAWTFADALNALRLPGAYFRAVTFQPTFQKFAGELCGGAFLHVTDRRDFQPTLAYVAVLQTAWVQGGGAFRWNDPPYEYEYEKLPIDILAGNDWLRPAIESQTPLEEIWERFVQEIDHWTTHSGPIRDKS